MNKEHSDVKTGVNQVIIEVHSHHISNGQFPERHNPELVAIVNVRGKLEGPAVGTAPQINILLSLSLQVISIYITSH